jgi:hypothetical protein
MSHSHEVSKTEVVTYTDREGKERKSFRSVMKRTDETQKAMENLRLGIYEKETPTTDPNVLKILNRKNYLFITSEKCSRRIIATFLREYKKGTYLHKTGPMIFNDSLDNDRSEDVLSAYENVDLFFLSFGLHAEASNRYTPQLVAQVAEQRRCFDKHCWVFLPALPSVMAKQWGEPIRALNSYNYIKLDKLSDSDEGEEHVYTPLNPPVNSIKTNSENKQEANTQNYNFDIKPEMSDLLHNTNKKK